MTVLQGASRPPLASGGCEEILSSIARHRPRDVADRYVRGPLVAGLAHLAPVLRPGARVLDVGCGRGPLSRALALNGLCVTGIDVSGEAVAAAVRESWADSRRATFRVSDACDLPFGGATFDALVSVSVLQYVAWPAVLRECRRVLAPGGRAIFIENLRGHPLARAYRTVRRTAWPYAPDLVPRRHLGWEDLGVFRDAFGSVEVRPFHLLSPAMLASHALREPRAATFGPIGNGGFRLLSQLDAALLSRWPGLARSAWLACIMCTQRSPRRETGQEAS